MPGRRLKPTSRAKPAGMFRLCPDVAEHAAQQRAPAPRIAHHAARTFAWDSRVHIATPCRRTRRQDSVIRVASHSRYEVRSDGPSPTYPVAIARGTDVLIMSQRSYGIDPCSA